MKKKEENKETEIIEVTAVQVPQTQIVQASPSQMLAAATEQADVLAAFIEKKKLYALINGRKYVMVEGWVPLARMNGVIPREVSNERQENGSYVARVQLIRVSDGVVLTEASGSCGESDDKLWANRPDHAKRSMATTRATGKACRLAYSWIMSLAGYEPTPKEEMPEGADSFVKQNKNQEVREIDRDEEEGSELDEDYRQSMENDDEDNAPYWVSEGDKGVRFINVKVGSHFSEAFLKGLGFKKGKQGTTWWVFYKDEIEDVLRRGEPKKKASGSKSQEVSSEEVESIRGGFKKSGLDATEIEKVMKELVGDNWKTPAKWSRENYKELCTFLGKHLQ